MPPASKDYDVCIVGAGPAGLACVSAINEPYSLDHLTEIQFERAAKIHHRHHRKLRVCVVDPNPEWMASWKSNFEQLRIRHLRSSALAHPNMFDRRALLTYANNHGRDEDELVQSNCGKMKVLSGLGRETNTGMWDLPSTSLFEDFCDDLCKNLKHTYFQGYASDLTKGKKGGYQLSWTDTSGKQHSVGAQRVILATGMMGKSVVPKGLVSCPTVSWKAPDAFAFSSKRKNVPQHVLVVGGGLTAAQAVLRIVEEGNTCVLCSRRPLHEKHFDVPVEWFDKRKTAECLSKFYQETIENRLQQLKEVRNGGSIPASYMKRLQKFEGKSLTRWVGEVEYENYNENTTDKNTTDEKMIRIRFEDKTILFDRVILATGVAPDCTANPFCKKVLENFPITVHGGFPDVTQDLRWSEDSEIFVIGAMSALQVGPDAGNLMGMRRAAYVISDKFNVRRWLRQTILANQYDAFMLDSDSESEIEDETSCCESESDDGQGLYDKEDQRIPSIAIGA
jgi:thioredoxin reductase